MQPLFKMAGQLCVDLAGLAIRVFGPCVTWAGWVGP